MNLNYDKNELEKRELNNVMPMVHFLCLNEKANSSLILFSDLFEM